MFVIEKPFGKVLQECDSEVLSSVYTGEKTLYIVAVASDGDLKRWEDFY